MTQSSRPRRARYITADGERALREELRYLWKEKRPAVTQSVRETAAQGDRSENAEYIYGKKQLREIDRRVRFLTKRLDELEVVDRLPDDTSRIYFGAWVALEDEAGGALQYRLVGPDEFDLSRGYLSVDSPLARTLLGKRQGDDIVLKAPQGSTEYHILDVWYDERRDGDQKG